MTKYHRYALAMKKHEIIYVRGERISWASGIREISCAWMMNNRDSFIGKTSINGPQTTRTRSSTSFSLWFALLIISAALAIEVGAWHASQIAVWGVEYYEALASFLNVRVRDPCTCMTFKSVGKRLSTSRASASASGSTNASMANFAYSCLWLTGWSMRQTWRIYLIAFIQGIPFSSPSCHWRYVLHDANQDARRDVSGIRPFHDNMR